MIDFYKKVLSPFLSIVKLIINLSAGKIVTTLIFCGGGFAMTEGSKKFHFFSLCC
jgi:hypothetical protein